jgi:type II secretory pathway pseudopilin PulG
MLSRKSFTLVELLIVIGIIALLAAMLLPALAIARESARTASCKSLMKQYMLATENYRHDWEDFYPDSSNIYQKESGFLLYFTGDKKAPKDVTRCPSDLSTKELGRLGEVLTSDGITLGSIGCNENIMGCSNRLTRFGPMAMFYTQKFFSQVPGYDPTKVMMWADYQNYDGTDNTVNGLRCAVSFTTTDIGSLAFRHHGASNASYADGHVGHMRMVGAKLINKGHDFADGEEWTEWAGSHLPFGPRNNGGTWTVSGDCVDLDIK